MYHNDSSLRIELAALHDDIMAAVEDKDYDSVTRFAQRAAILKCTLRSMYAR